jgi:mRNA interferase YafQ
MGRLMREIIRDSQFKADFKKVGKSGRYKLKDILDVIESLSKDIPLEPRLRDHALSNNWKDHRECHIKPDLLLIYRKPNEMLLQLVRIGSHSELF